jgi:hypothetical protein
MKKKEGYFSYGSRVLDLRKKMDNSKSFFFGSTPMYPGFGHFFFSRSIRLFHGESNGEGGSLAGRALYPDCAFVVSDDPLASDQSKSMSVFFGGETRLKNLF